MIKNWDRQGLKMDFSSMYNGDDHPSDIDLFYIARDNTLLLGEIKNAKGNFRHGQRHLLEHILKEWKHDGVIIYIWHFEEVESGAKSVDIGNCFVGEIYHKAEGEWRQPKKPTTVREVVDYFRR